SAIGLLVSYDRPSGPTLMVCFAIALVLGGMTRALIGARSRAAAAALAAALAAVVLLVGYAATRAQRAADEDHQHGEGGSDHAIAAAREREESHDIGQGIADMRLALSDAHPAVRAEAINQLAAQRDTASVPALMHALEDDSTTVRESAAKALGQMKA